MSEYLERTNASKPTFGDYVILEMKRYGVPNEYFIHDVMTHPFTSNSWRNVPIDACDPEEHLHDTSETVISVCTQGFHLSGWHIFNVRLSEVLPMKGDKWAWQESPLRSRIAELEAEKCVLVDQQREAKNHLIDKNLHIDSLYEEGYKLQQRIAELEYQLEDWTNNGWAEDYKARIAELEAAQRWIPVDEKPLEAGAYFVRLKNGVTKIDWTFIDGGIYYWWNSGQDSVTHYMPLPQPPEVQE